MKRLQREDVVRCIRRVGLALLVLAASATAGTAQGADEASRERYFGAVAEYFDLPRGEVAILSEWRLPADEIPVVLFVARRAGVSPEALVALRESGRGWSELSGRYRLDATHFYVPLPDAADAGRLSAVYGRFRGVPAGQRGGIALGDPDIVGLVNLRLLSETLRRSPEEILSAAGSGSWVQLYARLLGGAAGRGRR